MFGLSLEGSAPGRVLQRGESRESPDGLEAGSGRRSSAAVMWSTPVICIDIYICVICALDRVVTCHQRRRRETTTTTVVFHPKHSSPPPC
jgi:hypothetical protein